MKYIVLLTDKTSIYKGSFFEYWILETKKLQKEAFRLAEALRATGKQTSKEIASLEKRLDKYKGSFHLQTENGYTFYYSNKGSETKDLSEILKGLNLLIALKTDMNAYTKGTLKRELTNFEKNRINSFADSPLKFDLSFQYVREGISFSYETSDIPKEEWETVLKACMICFPFRRDLSWEVL